MRVLALDIHGFRGIPSGRLVLHDQVALVGPNGSGKSSIVDALCLVFGRQRLVRDLTEHDFAGSRPRPQDRIRIVATVGGFQSNDPDDNQTWFRSGRAVKKWWAKADGAFGMDSTHRSERVDSTGRSPGSPSASAQFNSAKGSHQPDSPNTRVLGALSVAAFARIFVHAYPDDRIIWQCAGYLPGAATWRRG